MPHVHVKPITKSRYIVLVDNDRIGIAEYASRDTYVGGGKYRKISDWRTECTYQGRLFRIGATAKLPELIKRIEAEVAKTGQQYAAESAVDTYVSLLAESDQTGDPAFVEWFGDSKVIDGDMKPLVCHHFTHTEFTEFSHEWVKTTFPKRNPEGIDRVGFWFTSNPAAKYGPRRMDCYLRITKPLWLDDLPGRGGSAFEQLERMVQEAGGATKLRENLKAGLYDGIILCGTKLDGFDQHVFLVFAADQIKLVTNVALSSESITRRTKIR